MNEAGSIMPYVPEESVPNPYHSLSECFPTVSVPDQSVVSVAWAATGAVPPIGSF